MLIYIKRVLSGSEVHSVKLPLEKIAHRKINPKEFFAVSKLEARACSSTGIKKSLYMIKI